MFILIYFILKDNYDASIKQTTIALTINKLGITDPFTLGVPFAGYVDQDSEIDRPYPYWIGIVLTNTKYYIYGFYPRSIGSNTLTEYSIVTNKNATIFYI